MDEEEVEFGGHSGGHGTGWGGWNRWGRDRRWGDGDWNPWFRRLSPPVRYVPVPVVLPAPVPVQLAWRWDPGRGAWYVPGYALGYSPRLGAWVRL
jgi:hypothetical protein